MKKVFTIISIISISASATFAQALPNNGFEYWGSASGFATGRGEYGEWPNYWSTLNIHSDIFNAPLTCIRATAVGDVHKGAAALKLVTKIMVGEITNGIATTGSVNSFDKSISEGIAYTGRPDFIVGYYKYTPVSTDNGFVKMILTGAGGDTDTVGIATFNTPNKAVDTYIRFEAPFVYKSANAVVNSLCIISSSASETVHFENSALFIDDLELITKVTGVKQLTSVNVTVEPNPSQDFVMVKNPEMEKTTLVIYDVTGHTMTQQLITDQSTTIYLNDYKNGMYFYSLSSEAGNLIKSGKIIIQK
ncbi:MAG: T9SS type A sorting domain-containing protein [Bacteroidia bacterium]